MRAISGGEIASLGLFFVVSEMCFIGCCLHVLNILVQPTNPVAKQLWQDVSVWYRKHLWQQQGLHNNVTDAEVSPQPISFHHEKVMTSQIVPAQVFSWYQLP